MLLTPRGPTSLHRVFHVGPISWASATQPRVAFLVSLMLAPPLLLPSQHRHDGVPCKAIRQWVAMTFTVPNMPCSWYSAKPLLTTQACILLLMFDHLNNIWTCSSAKLCLGTTLLTQQTGFSSTVSLSPCNLVTTL